jgi:hypothetical protein
MENSEYTTIWKTDDVEIRKVNSTLEIIKDVDDLEHKFYVSKPYPLLWLGEKKLEVRGLARLVRVVPGFLNKDGDDYYQYVCRSLRFPERPDYWEALEEDSWRLSKWQPEVFVPGIYTVSGGVRPQVVPVAEIVRVHRAYVEEVEKTFNVRLLVPSGISAKTNAIVLGNYRPPVEEVGIEDVLEFGVLCNPPEYINLRQSTLTSIWR